MRPLRQLGRGLIPVDRWLRRPRKFRLLLGGFLCRSRDFLLQLLYQVILAGELLLQQLGLPFQTLNLFSVG